MFHYQEGILIFAPFLAAVLSAVSTIYDKIILSRNRMNKGNFLVVLFLFLFLFALILVPWLGSIKPAAKEQFYVLLFAAEIVVAVVYNYYFCQGIQHECMYEVEMITMLTPIVTILFTTILIKAERNVHIVIAASIAALALIFSHIDKNHLRFNKYSEGLFLAVFGMALEAPLIDKLLEVYSPVALYAIRCIIIFLIFLLIFRPKFEGTSKKNIGLTAGLGLLGATQMILIFYGYRNLGVIYTTLVLMLGVLLVFIASYIIFKERLKKRIIIAAIIIAAAIVYAQLTR